MRPPRRFSLGLPLGVFVLSACFGDDPTGEAPFCSSVQEYSVGATVNGSLVSTDCVLSDGTLIDFYRFTVSGSQSLRLTLDSNDFNAFLWLIAGERIDGPPIAVGDDVDASTNAAIHILMAGGTFVVGANTTFQGQTGAYTFSSASVPESVSGCGVSWVTLEITTSQTISAADCVESGPAYFDELLMVLQQGQSATITQSSEDFAPRLIVLNSASDTVASQDGTVGGFGAQVTVNPAVADVFVIQARTVAPADSGAYTLTVE